MNADVQSLKNEIKKIKERNRRLEKDKARETSWTRRIAIVLTTYILITVFLTIIKVEKPFLSAIIPGIAYLISTTTIGILKNWWPKIIEINLNFCIYYFERVKYANGGPK